MRARAFLRYLHCRFHFWDHFWIPIWILHPMLESNYRVDHFHHPQLFGVAIITHVICNRLILMVYFSVLPWHFHHFVPRSCSRVDHHFLHVWDPLHTIFITLWVNIDSRAHVGEKMDFMHIFWLHFGSICFLTLIWGLIIFYMCISLLYLGTKHVVTRSCNLKMIITFYDPLQPHLYYFIMRGVLFFSHVWEDRLDIFYYLTHGFGPMYRKSTWYWPMVFII